MTQATRYYDPIWQSSGALPFSTLYTYYSNTDTPAPVYDQFGNQHPNPVVMDKNGRCFLYLDADINYRFVLFTPWGDLLYDRNDIKSLNGSPAQWTGQQGDRGAKGKQGPQGDSGDQGEDSPIVQGDKGLPYLNVLESENQQTYYIPKGIDAIYLTASAGGGSAANWSPYLFMFKVLDESRPKKQVFTTWTRPSDGLISTANNFIYYNQYKIGAIGFLPGSGFSGQSCYRKKIQLNKDIENKITVYVGSGGIKGNTTLNGNAGNDTIIYVNDIKFFTLKGGAGGENQFPKDDKSIPNIQNGGSINLNKGFKNGMLYFKNSANPDYENIIDQSSVQSFWSTTYSRRITNADDTSYCQDSAILVGYFVPVYNVSANQALNNVYPLNPVVDLHGEDNTFLHSYSFYQNKNDLSTVSDESFYKTSVKTVNSGKGAGSGGDAYFGFNSSSASNYMSAYYDNQNFTLTLLDENEMKTKIIEQLKNFTTTDACTAGVTTIPSKNDPVFWNGINVVKNAINNDAYVNFTNTGFYNVNKISKCIPANNPNAIGGNGANGYVKIEYGNIIEHTPD